MTVYDNINHHLRVVRAAAWREAALQRGRRMMAEHVEPRAIVTMLLKYEEQAIRQERA